jgi:transposase
MDKALRSKKKGVTREFFWNEYILKYPDGYRLTQFKELYRAWSKRVNSVLHIDHKAGDKMYVDFAGKTLPYVDTETGEILQAEIFVSILGASQLTYVEAVASQQTEDFILGCENSLYYFGGAPCGIVPDNLKAAVIKSDKYEPILNEVFRDFVHHYNITALPAGPYRPTHKALVEGAVKLIYSSVYTHIKEDVTYTLKELNKAIWNALEEHNNRLMKGRPYSRRQMYNEIECNALQELPGIRYELKRRKTVTVQKNNHVCLHEDKHYYSVPFKYIGRKVTVQYNQSDVEIIYKYDCIARHTRNRRPYSYTTVSDHLASNHQYRTDWNPETFLSRAKEVGPSTQKYLSIILEKAQHAEQSFKSCQGILSYASRAGKDRLEKACERAIYYQDYSYRTIRIILEENHDMLPLDNECDKLSMPEHENIRGGVYYDK